MKRVLAFSLCLLLLISGTPGALATQGRDLSGETALAEQLYKLGLVRGVGEGADGSADFALNRPLTRVEALVMLVRALGQESKAQAAGLKHPFTDVPPWADGYVSYAYREGITKGTSQTLFGANDLATGEMYLTFILRALGYQEGEWGVADFSWDEPWLLAAWCRILPLEVDRKSFLRADVVSVTCAALYAKQKDQTQTLGEYLIGEGAFTKAAFDQAFPAYPFPVYQTIEDQLTAYFTAQYEVGLVEKNYYKHVFHAIGAVKREGDVIQVWVNAFAGNAELRSIKDFNSDGLGSYGTNSVPWQVTFDAETLEILSALSFPTGYDWERISAEVREVLEELGGLESRSFAPGMVNGTLVKLELAAGRIAYQSPSYQEVVGRYGSEEAPVVQRLESDLCTVLLYIGGGPRPGGHYLVAIYKPGAPQGEGALASLPLMEEFWSKNGKPDKLWLSEDGKNLHYTQSFEERALFDEGGEFERVLHEAGSYLYSVNLDTWEVTLEHTAPGGEKKLLEAETVYVIH